MAVVADKVKGVRAGMIHDPAIAEAARRDDDINVLALGASYCNTIIRIVISLFKCLGTKVVYGMPRFFEPITQIVFHLKPVVVSRYVYIHQLSVAHGAFPGHHRTAIGACVPSSDGEVPHAARLLRALRDTSLRIIHGLQLVAFCEVR